MEVFVEEMLNNEVFNVRYSLDKPSIPYLIISQPIMVSRFVSSSTSFLFTDNRPYDLLPPYADIMREGHLYDPDNGGIDYLKVIEISEI